MLSPFCSDIRPIIRVMVTRPTRTRSGLGDGEGRDERGGDGVRAAGRGVGRIFCGGGERATDGLCQLAAALFGVLTEEQSQVKTRVGQNIARYGAGDHAADQVTDLYIVGCFADDEVHQQGPAA